MRIQCIIIRMKGNDASTDYISRRCRIMKNVRFAARRTFTEPRRRSQMRNFLTFVERENETAPSIRRS